MINIFKRFTVKRLIAFILICLPAALVLARGVYFLISGCFFNSGIAIHYFILPLLMIVTTLFVILSKRKNIFKIIVCFLLIAAFLYLWFVTVFIIRFERVAITKDETSFSTWQESVGYSYFEVDAPTDAENMEYYRYTDEALIYNATSDVLIVKYNNEEYKNQIDELENKYHYRETVVVGEDPSIEQAIVEIGGYTFKLFDWQYEEYKSLNHPKYANIIATNNQTKEIVYISYDNVDLDFIYSFESFVLYDCGWKYIR